jgi:uncharacterized protein YneF (UPF0154 family)
MIVGIVIGCSLCFVAGWICGAYITAEQIARAIEDGELSLNQKNFQIADQIRSGIYS